MYDTLYGVLGTNIEAVDCEVRDCLVWVVLTEYVKIDVL